MPANVVANIDEGVVDVRVSRNGGGYLCRLLVPVSTVDTIEGAEHNGWIYYPIAQGRADGSSAQVAASGWAFRLGWDVAPDADWHEGGGWRDSLPVVKMLS